MMVNDFISVAIQSPQSAQKNCTRFKSLYRVKCHQMQWRPNVHLFEMQSKTMQCIDLIVLHKCIHFDSICVFLLKMKMHFLFQCAVWPARVSSEYLYTARCISLSTSVYFRWLLIAIAACYAVCGSQSAIGVHILVKCISYGWCAVSAI